MRSNCLTEKRTKNTVFLTHFEDHFWIDASVIFLDSYMCGFQYICRVLWSQILVANSQHWLFLPEQICIVTLSYRFQLVYGPKVHRCRFRIFTVIFYLYYIKCDSAGVLPVSKQNTVWPLTLNEWNIINTASWFFSYQLQLYQDKLLVGLININLYINMFIIYYIVKPIFCNLAQWHSYIRLISTFPWNCFRRISQ